MTSGPYERIGQLERLLIGRWPTELDDLERDMVAAQIADCEARTAAALALFVQGDSNAAHDLVGTARDVAGVVAGLPIAAAFGSAGTALTAAIAGDRDRARAALAALQERAATFKAANELLIARHAGSNPG